MAIVIVKARVRTMTRRGRWVRRRRRWKPQQRQPPQRQPKLKPNAKSEVIEERRVEVKALRARVQ